MPRAKDVARGNQPGLVVLYAYDNIAEGMNEAGTGSQVDNSSCDLVLFSLDLEA